MCTMAFSTVRGGHNVVKVEDIEGPLTVGMKMLPLQVCNGPVQLGYSGGNSRTGRGQNILNNLPPSRCWVPYYVYL
ncbi:hypothetical protein M404DRAFT_1002715 [Pisolithus tinctorius Marx 270]|uniref:Uncharacterized protein n=1 Tax=Pisolithus tinctorius Marx 270 TaxID=870435 RepID=A0A0C3P3B1_PISTI|nr:hypothetical protein M404DRAFT_1002715 [Pisolithus tinctorius Marx 270]